MNEETNNRVNPRVHRRDTVTNLPAALRDLDHQRESQVAWTSCKVILDRSIVPGFRRRNRA
jgi:hypothetical protein